MLNMLRKRAQSTFIQVMVLAIAVVFIFWGVGSNMSNKRNSVAVVNDTEITLQEFQINYERAVDNFSKQFGGSVPRDLLKTFGIKQQVLQQMVQAELIRQGGREMGIGVSELATQERIKTMLVFQENGLFNLNRYEDILKQNRTNPSAFEAGLRDDLLSLRVSEVINGFSPVSNSAVEAMINHQNEKIKLAYLVLKGEDFLDDVTVDEAEFTKWYQENGATYKSEPKIRTKYLLFKYADDTDKVVLDEGAVLAKYEAEKEQGLYEIPEKRHARHILFKVAKQDDSELKEEVRKKAAQILELARQGEDFVTLAQEHSEGPTKSKGGDLGFFGRGQMVKSFDEAVFSMSEGQISEIVESPFGYHIIKLEEIKPKLSRSFEAVSNEVASRLKKEKAIGHTFKRASGAYEKIMEAGSIEKYETETKNKVVQSDYFPRSSPPAEISTDAKLKQSLLSLNQGELSSLIKLNNGYIIVFVDDFKEAEIPELEEVRQRVEKDYKQEKAVAMAADTAKALLKEAATNTQLSELAKDKNYSVEETELLSRSEMRASTSPPAQVVESAFKLEEKHPLAKEPIIIGDNYYLYEIVERQQHSEEITAEKRQQTEEQLRTAVQDKTLSNWLAYMEENSEVWTNQDLL